MTQSLNKKWVPILERMGVTGSKADWLSQYDQLNKNTNRPNPSNESKMEFPSLLPIAIKIAAQTISTDIVSVMPMSGPGGTSKAEMDRISAETKANNRDGKIDSIIEDKEFKESSIEEHPDYKGPVGGGLLMYLDYQYGSTPSTPNII